MAEHVATTILKSSTMSILRQYLHLIPPSAQQNKPVLRYPYARTLLPGLSLPTALDMLLASWSFLYVFNLKPRSASKTLSRLRQTAWYLPTHYTVSRAKPEELYMRIIIAQLSHIPCSTDSRCTYEYNYSRANVRRGRRCLSAGVRMHDIDGMPKEELEVIGAGGS